MGVDNRFAVISDIHYGDPNNINEIEKRLSTLTTWLNTHSEYIDSLIILGDCISSPTTNKLYTERLYKRIYQILSEIDSQITTSFLAGDQDVKYLATTTIEKYIGKTYGVRDKYIGLDTSWESEIGPQGKVDTSIFRYNLPKHGFIFSHHPIVPWNLRDNYWFSQTPELAYAINKRKIWSKIKTLQPKLVLNGHIREQKQGYFNQILCYSIKPFNKEFYDSTNPSGYFYTIATNSQNQIQFTTHVAETDSINHSVNKETYQLYTLNNTSTQSN